MPSGDLFSQEFYIQVVESAANTLTYQQLTTGAALFERRAMVIHRLEFNLLASTVGLILDESDYIIFGLSTSGQMTSVDLSDPNVIVYTRRGRSKFGTAASGWDYMMPHIIDWTGLPGGGKIVPAFPVYGFVQGTSLASACTVRIRGAFTAKVLKPEEYIELVEASRIIT